MIFLLIVLLLLSVLANAYLIRKRITEPTLKAGEEKDQEFHIPEGVLDTIPLGIVIANKSGAIVFRNNTADAIVDSWTDGVVGRKVLECLQKSIRGIPSAEQVRTSDSPPKIIEVITETLEIEKQITGATSILTDVTELIRTESMRRDFVANVSHELKTPIGAVSLLAETLSQEDDPDTTLRLAKRLEAEAQRLGRIVDDILDLSRIEGQAIEAPDVVELNEVVNEAVDRLFTFASRKKVEIKTKLNANTVEGDRLQLISLVHNIIENAVKYSEENSQVEVTLDFSKDSSTVCLNVIDSGIGIPEIEIERVFERFYRVDRARSRQSGGTGLGLSIVRNIATRHGGSVKIDSVEGEGTTVTVDLPVVIPIGVKEFKQ